MFAFDLPTNAILQVALPTGGEALMLHLGGGRFASDIPPLALGGVADAAGVKVNDIPLTWDSAAAPKKGHHALFAFDAAGALRSVEEAAAAGDEDAIEMLKRFKEAEKMLAAQQAVGMVPAAGEAAS